MNGWKYSQNRKVHQRVINKYTRKMNKALEKDGLWHGRFVIRQTAAEWFPYEDHSGWVLAVRLTFIDKKTGTSYSEWRKTNDWAFLNGYHVWERMNWFIVEYADVWREEGIEALHADKTDYTKLPVPRIDKLSFN